jgi:CHAT domain-containing protein
MLRPFHLCGVVSLVTVLAACAEPPHKEMNQAQGAIDAARAAGAEQFASAELLAATDALKQSEEAVTQNDYRLALSLAIDSRERAQMAAKTAVETRAKARGDAERVLAELNSTLAQARTRFDDPAVARLPRRTVTTSREALDAVDGIMQEARAAVEDNEYRRALDLTSDVPARIREAVALLDMPPPPPATRKRR